MRLIDADALKAAIPKTRVDIFENCRNCTLLCDEEVMEIIDKQPTCNQLATDCISRSAAIERLELCGAEHNAMAVIRGLPSILSEKCRQKARASDECL